MFGLASPGTLALFVAAILVFLGLGHRVLDRMRLTDLQAGLILVAMIVGGLLPDIPVGGGVRLNLGGFAVPIGVAAYLVTTAGTAMERTRALLASVVAAAAVYATDKLWPAEPSTAFSIDPFWMPAIAAGVVGYLAGRSRRSAFVAGVLGVVLADAGAAIENVMAGVPGAVMGLGGAGVFDATVLGGFLAVALAEIVGETREAIQGGPQGDRPEPLRRALEADAGAPRPAEGEVRRESGPRSLADRPLPMSVIAVGLSLALVGSAWLFGGDPLDQDEALAGSLYTLRDRAGGSLVFESQRRIHVDDEYIDASNHLFRVVAVEGRQAWAENAGIVDLAAELEETEAVPAASLFEGLLGGKPDQKVSVGVYMTHNDESYERNQGKANTNGRGGIHQVGRVLTRELDDKGYEVKFDETLHLPHDRGAYRRSMRTATKLVRGGADILFDVHRDAGPASSYAHEIEGEGVTKIRFVVGRSNPARASNLKFAKQLKAIADKEYPGLVKGIFFGRDAYNQQIGPHVLLLLELGTEKNAMQSAERGIARFADVVDRWVKQVYHEERQR